METDHHGQPLNSKWTVGLPKRGVRPAPSPQIGDRRPGTIHGLGSGSASEAPLCWWPCILAQPNGLKLGNKAGHKMPRQCVTHQGCRTLGSFINLPTARHYTFFKHPIGRGWPPSVSSPIKLSYLDRSPGDTLRSAV